LNIYMYMLMNECALNKFVYIHIKPEIKLATLTLPPQQRQVWRKIYVSELLILIK